ncbi:LysM peptidoglycan-binding domain-containing protein [Streptomyces sp. NPDC050315]|uniref:LysM peptidoglycan-binding domain-containing protein n=1 Tax=Streptomyces sp. NPDC050315 TaxID=3155039 RepID=UPI003417F42F
MPSTAPSRRTARRLAAAIRFLASGSALAAAVAGIPYVLIVTIGAPWPDPIVSLDDLLTRLGQPVSDPFVLQLFALVGWACWGYFMATLAREALWLVGRLPALVLDTALMRQRARSLPVHRAAATLLVGTLLLAMIGIWRLPTAQATAVGSGPGAETVAAVAPRHVAPKQEAQPEYTVYVVQRGDTLWGIAEQRLGDALLWPKIYQLSCTIRQSDGSLLSDPDLIRPGWRLHLPVPPSTSPSSPPSRAEAPDQSPRPPTEAPKPDRSPSADHAEPAEPPQSHADSDQQSQEQDEDQSTGQRPVAVPIGTASVIGVTTAAGIAAAIGLARWRAARRRSPRIDDLAAPLQDDDLLLSDALHRSNQAHLKARAARHHDADSVPRRLAPAEPGQPGTVAIAEKAGREVRIEALAHGGGVQLTGPGAEGVARHLAIAIAGAALRLRPASPGVSLITDKTFLHRLLPRAQAYTGGQAWTVTDTAAEALEAAEHALLEHARSEQALTSDSLDQGVPALAVLLLDGAGVESTRLSALAARAAPGQLAVVSVGSRGDLVRHRLTIQADGAVSGPIAALDKSTMFLLAPEAATEMLDTLHAAHGRQSPPSSSHDESEDPEPEPAPAAAPQREERPTPTATGAQQNQDPGQARTVHIRLFGGFKLFVHGKECALADTRKEETREFIALLAAHPSGLRGEEIAEKMQLSDDPVEAKAELENLRRAARRVFRTATGKKEVAFVVLSGQVHRLDPQYVSTDVAAFVSVLKQVTTADSPYARASVLQRAADTYSGPLCDGADYLWVHGLRAELHRRAVDALMLLAEHTSKNSADPEPALALLNQAADLDPANEHVYRRIIRLQLALERDDAAQRTLSLLTERLAGIDAEPEPATLALLQERHQPPRSRVAAGRSSGRGASVNR